MRRTGENFELAEDADSEPGEDLREWLALLKWLLRALAVLCCVLLLYLALVEFFWT